MKAKLTSRKFWAFVGTLIVILVEISQGRETAEMVASALPGIAYIAGEGFADAMRKP